MNKAQFDLFLKSFNKRHRVFCDHYMTSFNATESYKYAYPRIKSEGAARANASRLLTNANILLYIEHQLEAAKCELNISKKKIIAQLLEIYERAMKPVPVLDSNGRRTGQWTFDAFAAINSQRLLAKILGLFARHLNKKKEENKTILVRTFVVPSFNNSVNVPSSSPKEIKKYIENEFIKRNQQ